MSDINATTFRKRLKSLFPSLHSILSNSGMHVLVFQIPLKAVEFAVKRCWEVVAKEEHEDIDSVTEEQVWDHQWDQFLTYYYQYVHENSKFVEAIPTQIHVSPGYLFS